MTWKGCGRKQSLPDRGTISAFALGDWTRQNISITPVGLWGRIWTRDLPDMIQECYLLKCDIQCYGEFVKMYWFSMVTAIDTKTKKYCESFVCYQWSSCEAIHYSAHISLVLQFVPHWTQTKMRYRLKSISVISEDLHSWFSHLIHLLHKLRVEV